ncbi:DUF4404 family protein [Zooshikella marina]|uniref:DUF4404 family protein n=1 Tax=Zooshikella ganghwensis TaxID=202772 RepID=UPI000A05DEB1|nr:DUF4404 family protein [Zooshikella ganghwensis]MBU2709018.1 DUF4404 family protein [Zooshikella ganghwensis]
MSTSWHIIFINTLAFRMTAMTPKRLQPDMDELLKVIDDVEAADECTTAELRQIADEINTAINAPEAEPPIEALKHRLEEEAIKFAESHPAIASATRQVLDTLNNMGI